MITMRFRSSWFLLATAFLLSISTAQAGMTYQVTVNTSDAGVFGTTGFLGFQFNPGNPTSQIASVEILNFSGGTLGGSPSNTGAVAGTLPGAVLIFNSTPLNEYFQQFTYGAVFTFLLNLTGPALDSPNGTATAGSTFGLTLYDSAFNALLTNQSAGTGYAGRVDVNLNGTTTAQNFPTATSGPPVVTFADVPEPGTLLLTGLAFGGALLLRLRRSA